ncbi:related to TIP41-negatively regulates the TOR signaling pathway [Rhynchosporium graminicola]|uniref:Related to TIP41-negatively regulates the TOR signaling pathway n=1 Tax=Rhynchosporium graminicola TaxID=2792576 RepID=A0A1E1L8K3_9HELO|nr:related to TIP41-negatively regulates the TOR signaling pathway [Rhynchosporium commune]
MAFNGPINEMYPTPNSKESSTVSHRQKGFKISARKLPISKSGPIDEMTKKLKIPVPEMIFGDNMVSIEHEASGWRLEFNAYDALDQVDKTDKNMLKVAYSQEWSSSREKTHEGIKEVVKPFDWSYTTSYKGTVTQGKQFDSRQENVEPIPIELLKRPDPILFFEEVVLYESELDDNGISILSCKLRVMPDRMLLLCRLFMRLDQVLIRIRDTRIYVDFNTSKVIRDYTEKEERFEKVKQGLISSGRLPSDITTALRDPNQIGHLVPEVAHTLEALTVS